MKILSYLSFLFLLLASSGCDNPLGEKDDKQSTFDSEHISFSVGDSDDSNESSGSSDVVADPSLAPLSGQSVTENQSLSSVAVTIENSSSSAACSSVLSGSSSKTSLVKNSSIVLSGTLPNCQLALTPESGETGDATITLTYNDGSTTDSASFTLTVNAVGISLHSGSYEYSDGTYAKNCYEYRMSASYSTEGDGTYWIDPDGPGGNSEFQALCDMTSLGGGWTLVANRAGGTKNKESCSTGSTLGDFFNGQCGDVFHTDYGDSYSIGNSSLREKLSSLGQWRFLQYYSSGDLDQDDAFILHHTVGVDLFPQSTAPLPVPFYETPMLSVCDYANSNCDSTDVYFIWVGNGWFDSSQCGGGQIKSTYYKGNYGYCHDGISNDSRYLSNSLFGDRSGYNETKLFGHSPLQAKDFQERIWVR